MDRLVVVIWPQRPVDVGEPDLIAAVDALGVDRQKHLHAVPGPLCDLGSWRASTTARPSESRKVRGSPGERHSQQAGTLRIVRAGPSSVKGTRRSLCQPSGPDGEGQARARPRNAHGEPRQFRLGTNQGDRPRLGDDADS